MENINTISTELKTEIVNHAINGLENRKSSGIYGADLHSALFNEDYYIIGRSAAEEWLQKNVGVFSAIGVIKEYEQDNFGQVMTDLSEAERVVNMYVYILGEVVLGEVEHLRGECWDNHTTEQDIETIISELQNLIS